MLIRVILRGGETKEEITKKLDDGLGLDLDDIVYIPDDGRTEVNMGNMLNRLENTLFEIYEQNIQQNMQLNAETHLIFNIYTSEPIIVLYLQMLEAGYNERVNEPFMSRIQTEFLVQRNGEISNSNTQSVWDGFNGFTDREKAEPYFIPIDINTAYQLCVIKKLEAVRDLMDSRFVMLNERAKKVELYKKDLMAKDVGDTGNALDKYREFLYELYFVEDDNN